MTCVRPALTFNDSGMTSTMNFDFPMALAFMKSISFRIGLCPIQRYWPTLIPLIQSGRLQPERVITHRMNLSEGEDAYRIFGSRTEGVLKVVMDPAA